MIDDSNYFANEYDQKLTCVIKQREQDWRNGALVYQVLVDRFAPASDVKAKAHLYPSPKVLKNWHEQPRHGQYLASEKLWSHEIEFWGGDLQSLNTHLDHIESLGMDVLYLNPIHEAYTNHKYDALDYQKVSPEYGSREDVKALAKEIHERGMKLMLDGVFNHMGRNAPIFQEALSDESSNKRGWFCFAEHHPAGHRAWDSAVNLPELNLENPEVRDFLYGNPKSVVQSYLLEEDIDGWRLDVAFDLGFRYLLELTAGAHVAKSGSLVIGEIWNYPKEWFPAIDGIMNFTFREIILEVLNKNVEVDIANRMFSRVVKESGIDAMLKSWIVLDNHDTPRLRNLLKNTWQQQLAQVLQFTLPGSPNVYYGSEIGLQGGKDPEMRGPMAWEQVTDSNAYLIWLKQLVALRKSRRALKVGEFREVTAKHLIAYERYTDCVKDSIFVLVNPSDKNVTETVMLANSKLMNNNPMIDLMGTIKQPLSIHSGLLRITVPARKAVLLSPITEESEGYTPYKRVK